MIATIEKHWLIISILLLLVILACFLLWPSMAQTLAWILALSGVVLTTVFIARKYYLYYQQGRIPRRTMIRGFVIEVLGIVVTISLSVWLAGKAMVGVLPVVYKTTLAIKPGWVPMVGILAGFLIALFVGLGVGLVMRWVWGKLAGLGGKLIGKEPGG